VALCFAAFTPGARGDEAADGTSTSAASGSFLQRYGKANYLMWLTGPRTELSPK